MGHIIAVFTYPPYSVGVGGRSTPTHQGLTAGGPRRRSGYLVLKWQKENSVITRRDKAPSPAVSERSHDPARDASQLTPGAGHSEAGADESQHLLEIVQTSLEDDKAEDTVVIDLTNKSSIADFMVIASGRSQRQVGAMAEHLREKLKKEHARVSVEGATRCDWVLIDGGDVIVHLFRPEVRSFYNLEKMWGAELPEPSLTVATA